MLPSFQVTDNQVQPHTSFSPDHSLRCCAATC